MQYLKVKSLLHVTLLLLALLGVRDYAHAQSAEDANAFRTGYDRLVARLETRSLELRLAKLREEIEFLFLGGQLQPGQLDGAVARFETAGLERLHEACCPDLPRCITPVEGDTARNEIGEALAGAVSATAANDDPATLGRVSGALASVLSTVPDRCLCRFMSVERIQSCARGG